MFYRVLPFSVLSICIVLPYYEPLPKGYASIGELLKEYRTKNNLSLSEVARKLGVFASNVKYWEQGGMPSVENYNEVINLTR